MKCVRRDVDFIEGTGDGIERVSDAEAAARTRTARWVYVPKSAWKAAKRRVK